MEVWIRDVKGDVLGGLKRDLRGWASEDGFAVGQGRVIGGQGETKLKVLKDRLFHFSDFRFVKFEGFWFLKGKKNQKKHIPVQLYILILGLMIFLKISLCFLCLRYCGVGGFLHSHMAHVLQLHIRLCILHDGRYRD